jgi:hypothetical protein
MSDHNHTRRPEDSQNMANSLHSTPGDGLAAPICLPALFIHALEGGSDIDLAGTDPVTGGGVLLSARRCGVSLAPLSACTADQLVAGVPVGLTRYCVAPDVLSELPNCSDLFHGPIVTIQTTTGVVCVLGRDTKELLRLLPAHLPASVDWESEAPRGRGRDRGRKVGLSAKDRAAIRRNTFTLSMLAAVEEAGEDEAFEAVTKAAVCPRPDLAAMRKAGASPVAALAALVCWRRIVPRPSPTPSHRAAFVRGLPTLISGVTACRDLREVVMLLSEVERTHGAGLVPIYGKRFRRLVRDLASCLKYRSGGRDREIAGLLSVEEAPAAAVSWEHAEQAYLCRTPRRGTAASGVLPLPERQGRDLADLVVNSPAAAAAGPVEEYGVVGIEVGGWVNQAEGETLARLLAGGFADLCAVLGPWVVSLCSQANLALGVGSRGCGGAAAHYEPSLRVINVTKTRGDGSLAHELAHFLDHSLRGDAGGTARYLSDRVWEQEGGGPKARAMRLVRDAISVEQVAVELTGRVDPGHWWRRSWMASNGYSPGRSPQENFDAVADAEPNRFRHGRNAAVNAASLVDSLSKWGKEAVTVRAEYGLEAHYLAEAKKLGPYWRRPHELFARAFESWMEDQMTARGWRNEYLVCGTTRDYAKCRGLPYPTGEERKRINAAMGRLLAECELHR